MNIPFPIGKHFAATLVATIALVMNGCHADETITPPSQDFYTIQVSADYPVTTFSWVMASDKNGAWLDAKQLFAGQSTVLHGVVPTDKTFTIHFLYSTELTVSTDLTLLSYMDVPVNGTWLLKPPPSTTHSYPYEAFLEVSNFIDDDDNNANVSTNYGAIPFYHSGNSTATNSEFDVSFSQLPTDLLIAYFRNGNPYSLGVTVASEAESISIDAAAQEKPMDKQFLIDYSADVAFQGFFYGYKTGDDPTGDGFIFSNFSSSTGGGTVNLGYLNGYSQYKTYIVHQQTTGTQSYFKAGSAITQLPVFPSLGVAVNNPNALHFSATPTISFNMATVTLKNTYETYFTWIINQPNSTTGQVDLAIQAFPSDMTTLFLALDASKMKPQSISFTQYLDGTTYADVLNQKKNSVYGVATEYITVSKILN